MRRRVKVCTDCGTEQLATFDFCVACGKLLPETSQTKVGIIKTG